MGRLPSTRERMVAAAAELFAERGYAATTVADVQSACGLAPGSGALYKHFATKRDLLAAVVAGHVDTMRSGRRRSREQLPEDVGEALEWFAHAILAALDRDRAAFRVILRDLDAFPDLLSDLWGEVDRQVYAEFRRWVESLVAAGRASTADPAATSAVLVASITQYATLRALIGRRPGGLSARRFVDGWVATALAALGVAAPPGAQVG